ncbi:MAG: hypothetical protein ALECFALPRED_008630 [Alectoria fallacina]|uniref:Cytochrome b561 domain-containing protein n=1 Tax=Alectoria fallacina TaxID=1903189 RepID=A0A8H3EZJ4_9LECA|nr:MAG: hypothetical protein ALECFALPRED_008630 [Alectoria fallacina]
MASATGIPQENPATQGQAEDEPLLGRAGDASQQDGKGIQFNFVLGTAIIAQAGIWIVRWRRLLRHAQSLLTRSQLAATIWASVFIAPLSLFSAHPLLNSAGLLLTTQAILILQPTHAPKQKHLGTNIHAVINGTAVLSLLAAFIIIEYNKFAHAGAHFTSPHGILGLITYILFAIQAIVGITQYYTPAIYGSVDNAKAIYKYHRMSGYLLVILSFATVAAATQTGFNTGTLHIKLWAVIVAAVITLIGLLPRIKKQKLGFQ